MPRDQYYTAALKFAQEHGFEGVNLPGYANGLPSRSCPLARACDAFVGEEQMVLKRGRGQTVQIPKEVQHFIQMADRGEYRSLLGEPGWNVIKEIHK